MRGMANRNDPLAQTNFGSKSAILRHLGEYGNVDAPIDDGGYDVRPVTDFNADLDFRIERLE
jgi:hypothetical protein